MVVKLCSPLLKGIDMFSLIVIVVGLAVLGWFVFPTQAKAILSKVASLLSVLGKLWPSKPAVNVDPSTPVAPVANTTANATTTTTTTTTTTNS
jgi:hypothetical protein